MSDSQKQAWKETLSSWFFSRSSKESFREQYPVDPVEPGRLQRTKRMFLRETFGENIIDLYSGSGLSLCEEFSKAARCENYIFNEEAELIKKNKQMISGLVRPVKDGEHKILFELGTGSPESAWAKTIQTLEALDADELGAKMVYMPVEWSIASMESVVEVVRERFPQITIVPRLRDFNNGNFDFLHQGQRIGVQYGSSISNVAGFPEQPLGVDALAKPLANFRRHLNRGDFMIIGLDQNQDPASAKALYMHPLHVRFSESFLTRTREDIPERFLSKGYKPKNFRYQALDFTHPEEGLVIAHAFVATKPSSFVIDGAKAQFKEGDNCGYDNSRKYNQSYLDKAFRRAGLTRICPPIRSPKQRMALQFVEPV